MSFSDWYNKQAISIWREYGSNQSLVPLLIPERSVDMDMLVVGMNPSFNVKHIQSQIDSHRDILGEYSLDSLFKWDRGHRIADRTPHITKLEALTHDEYAQYFKPVQKFMEDCGYKTWFHIDLFLMRETAQNIALKMVEYDEIGQTFNEFGNRQIELFVNSISKLSPKVVVVINATAAVILNHRYNRDGATRTKFAIADVDVHLGGMLGGSRAMDRFSRQRLVDEIRRGK